MDKQKIDKIIATSPYPWWEWNPITDEVTFSALKATQIGYDPADFAGRGYAAFTELIHPGDLAKAMDSMKRVLYAGADLYQVDYRIKAKAGGYRWYMDRGFVLSRNQGGKPTKIRGIVIDLGAEGIAAGGPENAFKIIADSLIESRQGSKSLITICASCKKAKVEGRKFAAITQSLYELLSEHTSHTICPDCVRQLYPEMADQIQNCVLGEPA